MPGEGEAGAGRPPYLPSLPTHCPEPSLGHNHCDSALAKMHRLVEVTVSAYFDINVNVSPTVSQPVCVCVCPAVSALSRSLLEVSMRPGRCCQTSHCGSSLALGVVLSQILAPHLIPAFPHSIWGWFCLFFLLSPCRSRCCTQTCEHGAAGEGDWFILALDRTSACVGFPSDLSQMALEQTGNDIPTQSRSQPSCKRRLGLYQGRGVGRNSASLPACLSLRSSHLPPAPPPAPGNHGQTVQTVGSSGTGGPGEIKCTIAAVPCLVAFVPWSRAGSRWQRSCMSEPAQKWL